MPGQVPISRLQPRRLLVRGVNWLGDSVMTTPALQRLRQCFPEAHIALLAPQKVAELWGHHPSLNAVHAFAPGEGLMAVARRLREQHFDTALVLPNSPRSALEVWLAGIPRRVGLARPWRNWCLSEPVAPRPGHVRMRKKSVKEIRQLVGSGPDQGASDTERPGASAHQVHEYLHLAAALGASAEPVPPLLVTAPQELDAARVKFGLGRGGSGGGPLLGLSPGAEYGPAKRWPAERFVAAAREIQRRTDCVWLLLGGGGDVAVAAEVEAGLRAADLVVHNLAGKTSLRELMVVLKLCRVLLSNDSGSMHVAAALGVPVVVPFGSTSPELTGPGLPGDARHQLLRAEAACAPCFRRICPIDFRCMTGIPVERVVTGVITRATTEGV